MHSHPNYTSLHCLIFLLLGVACGYAPIIQRRHATSTALNSLTNQTLSSSSSSSPLARSPAASAAVVGPAKCLIYDTTLRDGTQGLGISATVDDKLSILSALSAFGVDYVEGGWPGSNPKDREFFDRCRGLSEEVKGRLVAFGSTRRKYTRVEDDRQVAALLESGASNVCIVAKAHLGQVEGVLGATREEALSMVYDTVRHLTSSGVTVFVDLEHYFDGAASDPTFASDLVAVCAESGAEAVVLCDTNGGRLPWDIETFTRQVIEHDIVKERKVTVGVHCHDDMGMAVANSLSAVRAGAGMVQGCVNGIGERTGNANLITVVGALSLKMGSSLNLGDDLSGLTSLSRYVDEVLNRAPDAGQAFVGSQAFAHKGGLHVAAMEKDPESYQFIDPASVGNVRRTVVSELSGRQNILLRLRDIGVDYDGDLNERANAILTRVKKLEAIGYSFEGADASVQLMMLHATRQYCPPFKVLDYSATVWDSHIDSASRVLQKAKWGVNAAMDEGAERATARATVKVATIKDDAEEGVMDVVSLEVADGAGPVDALAQALLQALGKSYPELNVILVDYKVRILDNDAATEAATRVMIEFNEPSTGRSWSTVSVDRNVISASLNALVDGFEFALLGEETACKIEDYDAGWD